MFQRLYFLLLFFIALVLGGLSFRKYIDFEPEHLMLMGLFLVLSLSFNYILFLKVDLGTQVSFVPNYGFPIILLTNPLIHFIFVFSFEIISILTDKSVEKKERFWEIIYNASSLHILNTMAYYLFYSIFLDGIAFTPLYVLVMASLLMGVSICSKLSVLFILFMEKQVGNDFDFTKYFFKQTISNMFLSSPVYMILVYSFSEREYILFGVTLFLQIYTANTLKKSGENIKKDTELNSYKKIAYRDPMTDSYNRRYLKKYASELEQQRKPVTLVMADLDNFKCFNDSYNHDVGDQVLECFVKSIKRFLYDDERLIRNGGEEFLLIMNDMKREIIEERVNDICHHIATHKIPVEFNGEKMDLNVSASFGVSFYEGKPNQTIEQVMIEADNLLYKSKQEGKNRVSIK